MRWSSHTCKSCAEEDHDCSSLPEMADLPQARRLRPSSLLLTWLNQSSPSTNFPFLQPWHARPLPIDCVLSAVHFEAAGKLARALHTGEQLRKRLEKVTAAWAAACVRLQQREGTSPAGGYPGATGSSHPGAAGPSGAANRLFGNDFGEHLLCVLLHRCYRKVSGADFHASHNNGCSDMWYLHFKVGRLASFCVCNPIVCLFQRVCNQSMTWLLNLHLEGRRSYGATPQGVQH